MGITFKEKDRFSFVKYTIIKSTVSKQTNQTVYTFKLKLFVFRSEVNIDKYSSVHGHWWHSFPTKSTFILPDPSYICWSYLSCLQNCISANWQINYKLLQGSILFSPNSTHNLYKLSENDRNVENRYAMLSSTCTSQYSHQSV